MVTLSAILQAPVQALLRPAVWLPGIKTFHSHKEVWKTDVPHEEFFAALLAAIKGITDNPDNKEFWDFHKIVKDGSFVRILVLTRAEWLDVVEIKYTLGQYEAYSFSTGLVPLIVPFACIVNLAFFFVPFLDMNLNMYRLQRIRDAMEVNVTVKGPEEI